eukprot:3581933-Alexandrium_andersonii.AAC.1
MRADKSAVARFHASPPHRGIRPPKGKQCWGPIGLHVHEESAERRSPRLPGGSRRRLCNA